jgi:AraC family transcriptional regulator
MPADSPVASSTSGPVEFIAVSFTPGLFERLAASAGSPLPILRPGRSAADPLSESIVITLKEELEAGSRQRNALAETLASALVLQMIRRHGGRGPLAETSGHGLSRVQLTIAIDYLHSHFAERVSLATLAAEVGVSPFQLSRRFRASTGLPPLRYLNRLRVHKVREWLSDPAAELADVAARAGFCDQSHMAAHFRAVLGVSPAQFMREAEAHKNLL